MARRALGLLVPAVCIFLWWWAYRVGWLYRPNSASPGDVIQSLVTNREILLQQVFVSLRRLWWGLLWGSVIWSLQWYGSRSIRCS